MVGFVAVVLVIAIVVFLLWLLLRLNSLTEQNRRMSERLDALETALRPRTGIAPTQTASVEAPPLRPPPLAAAAGAPPPVRVPMTRPPRAEMNWEQFMGAKLFAWLGGFAAFLGAVFFVRYSFEHNLIPAAVRVAIGYVFGVALVGGGLAVPRRRYAITGQTLIATGIVCLYAVTYACNAIYHFAAFGPAATFTVMALVTVLAFGLAVQLDARVIAVLGLVGGFLTPLLLGPGGTHATPLFAYVAVLDVGLLAISLRRGWHFLAPLAAVGTAAMELLWTGRFFLAATAGTMLPVAAVFCAVFAAACLVRRSAANAPGADAVVGSAAFVAAMAFVLGIAFLGTSRPVATATLFGFCGVGTLTLLLLGYVAAEPGDERSPGAQWRPWLPVLGLFAAGAFEYAWHGAHGAAVPPAATLRWYAAVYVVFAAYPFAFRRRFAAATAPWATAALVGAVQFPLVYQLVRYAWPHVIMGLLPLAFALVPAAGLAVVRRGTAPRPIRLNQLAWFGALTLLFITLVFPVQFHRQWVTLGWALEGTALLWLFRRVPHRGLIGAAVVLLGAAFARLAFNPAVLNYHPRGHLAVLNWYLYTYAIVTAALYAGGRLVTTVDDRALGMTVPALLNTLGTILAFLLLNIEIADFFTPPGARVLTFQFSGDFARDMTYTIAWALFALGLLLVSLWRRLRAGRWAGLALLGAAALKLFGHDLSRLDALYRVGALFGVAAIAIAASVAYQRLFAGADHEPRPGRP